MFSSVVLRRDVGNSYRPLLPSGFKERIGYSVQLCHSEQRLTPTDFLYPDTSVVGHQITPLGTNVY